MNNPPVISVKNLSKEFKIFNSPWTRFRYLLFRRNKEQIKVHWALRDLNFQLSQGETLGIIGRNGSGKTTLLRLLAGTTKITLGSIRKEGRISSLLDLGAGFNPEFSGKANVYLKAGLFGLDKGKIKARFKEIVEFAELEEFIDDPLKTYSTGMVVRLGFAVAAYMDFDILLIDEVLAVGDLTFRRKCLQRMMEFKRVGKTILIASHNLGDLGFFCDRLILLENSRIQMIGTTEEVMKKYWSNCEKETNRIKRISSLIKGESPYSDDVKDIEITGVKFINRKGEETYYYRTGEEMTISVKYNARKEVNNPIFRVQFFRNDGLFVHGTNTSRQEINLGRIKGEGEIEVKYSSFSLLEADYYVSVGIWPDEHRSFMSDRSYDLHDMRYIVRVKSKRRQGGGIVCNKNKWIIT